MTKDELLQIINSTITDNNSGDITAEKLRNTLNSMVEYTPEMGNVNLDGYLYISTATPSTTPIELTGSEKVFYVATREGIYSNFTLGNISELSVLKSLNGNWIVEGFGIKIQDNVKAKAGNNLIDEDKVILGKAISQSGAIVSNDVMDLTDYIPVNEQNITHSGNTTTYWPLAVYNSKKERIRLVTSKPYTYQEGDCYIRFNLFQSRRGSQMANYGTTLLSYEPYNPIGGYLTEVYDMIGNVEIDDSNYVKFNTINLINVNDPDFTVNYGIGGASNGNGRLISNSTMSVTGFIPINKQNIIHNGNYGAYWCSAVYDEDKNFLAVVPDKQYTYNEERGDYYIRLTVFSNVSPMANYGTTLLSYEPYNPIGGYLTEVYDMIEELHGEEYTFKKAIGGLTSNHSYEGEMNANPIKVKPYVSNVGWEVGEKQQMNIDDANIVAVNHDDLNLSDITDNRRIYNKYGFTPNFSYILRPFSDASEKANYINNIKDMLLDGFSIGFHAPFTKSYWMFNRLFDIRPDSTFTFAPTLDDIKSMYGTSANINSYYYNIPAGVTTAAIGSLTTAQFAKITRCFTIYGDSYYKIKGLNLNDTSVEKTPLQWLEYWYNELVDNTLGYSSESEDISTKYAEDYDYLGGSYPDAEHLISDKVVFADDTSNTNYSNTEYQKVGRFKKGLFKGCASCCNYEVIDRILTVAEAVFKHYYGEVRFSAYNVHGMGYANVDYIGDNGLFYLDKSMQIIAHTNAPLPYCSLMKSKQSVADIFLKHGIRMTNQDSPRKLMLESQIGLFFGQQDVRGSDWNYANKYSGGVSYLNFFGLNQADVEGSNITESDFNLFLKDQDFWLKFAFENAGQTITNNGKSFYIQKDIKNFMRSIMSTKGTGKIPCFSYDTNTRSFPMSTAVSLICQYCYDNNYRIVNVEEARQIANSRKLIRTNYIPNPSFRQSLLAYFGGESSDKDAYLPDGLYSEGTWSNVDVSEESVNGKLTKVLSLSANSSSYAQYKIYGIEEGDYRLTLDIKGNNSNVEFFVKKNNDFLEQNFGGINRFNAEYTADASSDWETLTYEFSVKGNSVITPDNDFEIISDGYGDNVSNVVLKFNVNGGHILVANPKLISV